MKAWTLSTNSWHYKLIDRYLNQWHKRDLCSYTRQVLLALMLCTFAWGFGSAIVGLWLYTVITPLLGWYFHGIFPFWIGSAGALRPEVLFFGFTLAIGGAVLLKIGFNFLFDKLGAFLTKKKDEEIQRKSAAWDAMTDEEKKAYFAERDRLRELRNRPGFWTLQYRRFKEKTCVKLEFDDDSCAE